LREELVVAVVFVVVVVVDAVVGIGAGIVTDAIRMASVLRSGGILG
jgi:glycerol dehydrogenase-like iron-containing ADH family enzyme